MVEYSPRIPSSKMKVIYAPAGGTLILDTRYKYNLDIDGNGWSSVSPHRDLDYASH